MSVFKEPSKKIEYDNKPIDFPEKTFYLSCTFSGGNGMKKIFARELKALGAKCGIKNEDFKLDELNYLIVGSEGHKGKEYGQRAEKVQKHNEDNPDKKIPILREIDCKELMEKYRKTTLPRP